MTIEERKYIDNFNIEYSMNSIHCLAYKDGNFPLKYTLTYFTRQCMYGGPYDKHANGELPTDYTFIARPVRDIILVAQQLRWKMVLTMMKDCGSARAGPAGLRAHAILVLRAR